MLYPPTNALTAAERRSRTLLCRVLSLRQRNELTALGCFTVDVRSRGRFCILPRYGYNVVHLCTGTRYCALPCSMVPTCDIMLGQKLVLEHCPEKFFAVANIDATGLDRTGVPPIVRTLVLPRSNSVEDDVSSLVAKLGCLADVWRTDSAFALPAPHPEDFDLILVDIDSLHAQSLLLAQQCRERFPRAQLAWLAQVPAHAPLDWRAACTPEFPIFSKNCLAKAWAVELFRKLLPTVFPSALPTTLRHPSHPAPKPRFASQEEALLAKLCAWRASRRR